MNSEGNLWIDLFKVIYLCTNRKDIYCICLAILDKNTYTYAYIDMTISPYVWVCI